MMLCCCLLTETDNSSGIGVLLCSMSRDLLYKNKMENY